MKKTPTRTISERSGSWRRNLSGEAAFSSFVPVDLEDVDLEYSVQIANALQRAALELGRLDGLFAGLGEEAKQPVVERLRRKEAEASWDLSAGRIRKLPKGLTILGGFPEYSMERDDLDEGEIGDLVKAISYAVGPFDDLPLSRRLLANAHYLMTQSPRYEKKYPGEIRRSPTWIGAPDSILSTASFVFPVVEDMDEALSQLERYANSLSETNDHGVLSGIGHDLSDSLLSFPPFGSVRQDDIATPSLVKVALAHYQFEVIHPFIDGNGRIGRLLSQLMLIEAGLLPADILLLSGALKDRAEEYYEAIEKVERFGAYEDWVEFFLGIIADAARDSIKEIESITSG